MIAFQRLSTVPTVPDLLRRQAERRAARSLRALRAEAWRCPATITIVWRYRSISTLRATGLADAVRRRAEFFRPSDELARIKPVSREMVPSQRSMQTRSRATARSRHAAMQANSTAGGIQSWTYQVGTEVCFASACAVLVTARAANWCHLLSPGGLGAAMAYAERLTRAGMRL